MYWYRAWYGSWNETDGVRRIDGTYNRKKIFDDAQRVANKTGKVVTIEKEIPTLRGLESEYYKVKPQLEV